MIVIERLLRYIHKNICYLNCTERNVHNTHRKMRLGKTSNTIPSTIFPSKVSLSFHETARVNASDWAGPNPTPQNPKGPSCFKDFITVVHIIQWKPTFAPSHLCLDRSWKLKREKTRNMSLSKTEKRKNFCFLVSKHERKLLVSKQVLLFSCSRFF